LKPVKIFWRAYDVLRYYALFEKRTAFLCEFCMQMLHEHVVYEILSICSIHNFSF